MSMQERTAGELPSSNGNPSMPAASRDRIGIRANEELRLDVIREMLSTMDTVPETGQRYIMTKVVGFIGKRIPPSGLALSRRNETTLMQIVERLEHEATGVVVDAERFNRHAQILLELLEVLVRGATTFDASAGAIREPRGWAIER
jgi:hypothetical protein